MSVLIKGMKMPTCCEECQLMHEGYLYGKFFPCVCNAIGGQMLIKPSEVDMRDGLCPLVEVPTPHGDLIDRDALGLGEYEKVEEDTGTLEISLGGLLEVYHKVKEAPAIIAREDGETDADT